MTHNNYHKESAVRILEHLLPAIFIAVLIVSFSFSVLGQTDVEEPSFAIEFEKEKLLIPCPASCRATSQDAECSDGARLQTKLTVAPDEPDTNMQGIWFEFLPEQGSVNAAGPTTFWSLDGESSGTYWLRVKINRGFETLDVLSKSIEVSKCSCICEVECGSITIQSEGKEVAEGEVILFRALQNRIFSSTDRLKWTVENGEVVSGGGSRILKVRAVGDAGAQLKVKAELTSHSSECSRAAEASVSIIKGDEDPQ